MASARGTRIIRKSLMTLILSGSVAAYADNPVYLDLNLGVNTSYNSIGLNADIGYMFIKYFGVEGGYTYSPTNWSSSYNLFDVAAKGVLPLGDLFSLYAKLGLGINDWTSQCTGCNYSNVGLLYGAGAQFAVSHNWSLHIEDYSVTGSAPNFVMFGAQYKF